MRENYPNVAENGQALLPPIEKLVAPVRHLSRTELELPNISKVLTQKMYEIDEATAAHQERVGSALSEVVRPYLGEIAAKDFKFIGETHDLGKADPGVNKLIRSYEFFPEDSPEKQAIMQHEPLGESTLLEIAKVTKARGRGNESRSIRVAALAAGSKLKPGSEIGPTFEYQSRELALGGLALHCVDVSDALLAEEGRNYRLARQETESESTMKPEDIMQKEVARLYSGNEKEPLDDYDVTPLQVATASLAAVRKKYQTET